jgi:Tol biopolymer transport system component
MNAQPHRHFAALCLAASLILAAVSFAAQDGKRLITEKDIFQFNWTANPEISHDGSQVAFVKVNVNEKRDGYDTALWGVSTSGSSEPWRLTNGPRDSSPRWSPDGKRLAFVSFADRNGASCPASNCAPNGEIYVVNADGSGLRRLTRSRADEQHPTWSPDGRKIAFASGFVLPKEGHRPWLMTMPAGGGKAVRVGRFSGVLDPSWSPAGVG